MLAPADRFVLFRFGAQQAALPAAEVAEILPLPRLHRPPGAPSLLAGFMNLGGEAVPVIDVGRLFDAPPTEEVEPAYRHLVRLRATGTRETTALLVDRVLDAAVAAEARQPVENSEALNGCVAENVRMGEELVPVLSTERLLAAEEAARLAELSAKVQARIAEWHSLPA